MWFIGLLFDKRKWCMCELILLFRGFSVGRLQFGKPKFPENFAAIITKTGEHFCHHQSKTNYHHQHQSRCTCPQVWNLVQMLPGIMVSLFQTKRANSCHHQQSYPWKRCVCWLFFVPSQYCCLFKKRSSRRPLAAHLLCPS